MTSQHFVSQSDEWKCLRNKPKKGGNYTLITEKIEYEYSLDDQVRQRTSKISNTRYTVWNGVRPGILLLPEFPTARPMRASVVRPSGQLTTLLQNISRTPHSCARPRRVLLWMGLPVEGRSGGCRDLDRHEFVKKNSTSGVSMVTVSQLARTLVGVMD